MGTERIRSHDLNFSLPEISADELGQICVGFEMMRAELLKTNRELWHQAEERKRLNAAFAHDLRNPVTVLKGSIRLMKSGRADEHTLERMDRYVQRIEQYVEAMSSIQRLEQLRVRPCEMTGSVLREELEIRLTLAEDVLCLTVSDDGPRFSGTTGEERSEAFWKTGGKPGAPRHGTLRQQPALPQMRRRTAA